MHWLVWKTTTMQLKVAQKATSCAWSCGLRFDCEDLGHGRSWLPKVAKMHFFQASPSSSSWSCTFSLIFFHTTGFISGSSSSAYAAVGCFQLHVLKDSKGRHLGVIIIRCPNHHNWFHLTRSSSSTLSSTWNSSSLSYPVSKAEPCHPKGTSMCAFHLCHLHGFSKLDHILHLAITVPQDTAKVQEFINKVTK